MYSYEDKFFDFVDKSSSKSALALIPKLVTVLQVDSILDVGCGRGIWLAAWKQLMNCSVTGIDGNYVDNGSLHILRTEFFAKDLSQSFDLGRTFDLVQCLEVAEHLPESSADSLADNLVKHGDLILFSAARPGQGGEHHVNERPLTYWLNLGTASIHSFLLTKMENQGS
ncbi:MAG: methyltransferase domain-containing protein [Betaproteobacteria bacterium]|nr:methyltransferase domain-containing protein [Betaproteobacteria bacterium]